MSRDDFPSRREIEALPRWAAIALAVRCTQRVMPLLEIYAKDEVLTGVFLSIQRYVNRIEECASAGSSEQFDYMAVPEPSDVAVERWIRDIRAASRGANPAVQVLECVILLVQAMKSYRAPDLEGILRLSRQAITSFNDRFVIDAILSESFDLQLLLKASASEGWNHDTGVSPDLFGPLWLRGVPVGWPSYEVNSEKSELVITMDIPEGMTDDEVLQIIGDMTARVDDVHRAYGGHGFKIEFGNIDIESEVLVPIGGQP